MNNIGIKIKEARKAKGLTQKELAKLLNCSHTTISKYEQGEIENMPRPRMNLLAEILEVSPIVLFGLVDNTEKKARQIMIDEQDYLTDTQKELLAFVESVPEEKAGKLLQAMKLFLAD